MGRDNELVTLETLYERVVREGAPHLVSLVGEAGVGKSRLLREFEHVLGEHSIAPTVRTGPLPPVRLGHRVLGARRGAARRVRDRGHRLGRGGMAEALALRGRACSATASQLSEPGEREAALIGRLLGIEVPPELVPTERDPERLRESFFSALRMGMERMRAAGGRW